MTVTDSKDQKIRNVGIETRIGNGLLVTQRHGTAKDGNIKRYQHHQTSIDGPDAKSNTFCIPLVENT